MPGRRVPRWAPLALISVLLALACAPSAPAATIVPDTFADELGVGQPNGNCTLREAVIAANDDDVKDACTPGDGADVIVLEQGTYTLSVPGGDGPGLAEVDDNVADLDLHGDLVIAGHEMGTTVDAGGVDRAFTFAEGTSTLRDLTITGGLTPELPGGGVSVLGDLGGATGRIVDSTITGNDGEDHGGGGGQVSGADARLVLVRSVVTLNQTNGVGGGGLLAGSGGELELVDSRVASNMTTGTTVGGGIAVNGGGDLVATDSVIADNQADSFGGGINLEAAAELAGTRVVGNTSEASGGGIRQFGGSLTVSRSELSGNDAFIHGGGLEATNAADITITNTTVSDNTADSDGTGLPSSGDGGGLGLGGITAESRISNTTITGNVAPRGGGVRGTFGGERPDFRGVILSGNTGVLSAPDCIGDITSDGYNLFGTADGCDIGTPQATDQPGVDAMLLPLADNGGATLTHALRGGSPAVGAGPPDAPATDQRGAPRADPEIGAYELVRCRGRAVNVVGTPGPDRLHGTAARDVFLGLGRADVILGRAGRDIGCAGAGRDTLRGGPDTDKLLGQGGRDLLVGGGGRGDLCHGGAGRDSARRSCERVRSVP